MLAAMALLCVFQVLHLQFKTERNYYLFQMAIVKDGFRCW